MRAARGEIAVTRLADSNPRKRQMTEESRCDRYRDLLEAWAGWWNAYGRRYYDPPHGGSVLPPITKTVDALVCLACQGLDLDGERCRSCGRLG
jgi:hypothetical protein